MPQIEELKKPINLVSIILGVIGIILSIYFYNQSIQKKSISYIIDDQSSLIFYSQNSASQLKLFEKDTIPISRNVYLISGYIWNSGDLPINKEDIRLPLKLKINNSNRILDFRIVKQKISEIANFSLKNENTNVLVVGWKYFDPKFGFSFQIIYEGNYNPNFQLEGNILGITKFRKEELNIKKQIFWSWPVVFFIPVFSLVIILFIYTKKKGYDATFSWISLFLYIMVGILLVWIYFFGPDKNIPI